VKEMKKISHLTEINIGGNYARKQQKCETVISDARFELAWWGAKRKCVRNVEGVLNALVILLL
jgi:hypothetical protein